MSSYILDDYLEHKMLALAHYPSKSGIARLAVVEKQMKPPIRRRRVIYK
jgi:hypothetical protein